MKVTGDGEGQPRQGEVFVKALVKGPYNLQRESFSSPGEQAREITRIHSQASFPSKLERAMANACRAHERIPVV